MEEIHLEGTGDVVDAVPVRRVRPGPDRVLHDPDAVGHDLEMLPADGMERCEIRHRLQPATPRPANTRLGATTVAKRSRYSAPTADQTIRRL